MYTLHAAFQSRTYLYTMSISKRHIIYWLFIYVAWTFMKSSMNGNVTVYAKVNLINIPIFMSAFYFLKHYQIPYLFDKKKIFLFCISLIFSSLILYLFWRVAGFFWLDDLRELHGIPFFRFDRYLVYFVQFYSPGILLLAWEMQEEKRKEKDRILELEKEKLNTELKFLKAQLNPHFLFNTFNNLYSLVITGDPNAPNMILQLSSILEFILYKSQVDKISLDEELAIIEQYIALEKIRYGEKISVEFAKKGNTSVKVAPLLILSLVENAFKHGASGDLNVSRIKIYVEASEDQINCNIWNTKSKFEGASKDPHKKGIGLSNVKRQLELQYPNDSTISIEEKVESFEVTLSINI